MRSAEDSVWYRREDKLMDRILGHSPVLPSNLAFWKDLQDHQKMAETPIESTKDPKWEVWRKAKNVRL